MSWTSVFNKSVQLVLWKQHTHRVCQVGPWVLSLLPNHSSHTQDWGQKGVFVQNGHQCGLSGLTDTIHYRLISAPGKQNRDTKSWFNWTRRGKKRTAAEERERERWTANPTPIHQCCASNIKRNLKCDWAAEWNTYGKRKEQTQPWEEQPCTSVYSSLPYPTAP